MKPHVWLLSICAFFGCASGAVGDLGPQIAAGETPTINDRANLPVVPPPNRSDSFFVGSWNLHWFGDPERGPEDDELQGLHAASVLNALSLDIVGLSEVVSISAFHSLVETLPGYRGLLAVDSSVPEGEDYYYGSELKVALLYRDYLEVDWARLILKDSQWDFAGRPPLEIQLRFVVEGEVRTLVVIVAHFKALANADSYERRERAAIALQHYLDDVYPDRWVLVIGDFNDDIDESTYSDKESPFHALRESPDYRFTTDSLSKAGTSTTTNYPSTIDHHLATDDLAGRFIEGSAQVVRPDLDIEGYATNTSDHYPVTTGYDLR